MHGTLIKWKADRGFGFIRCDHDQQEVFVHISAFPSTTPRPKVGESLGFDIETTAEGKTRAINVSRAASGQINQRAANVKVSKAPRKTSSLVRVIVGLLIVGLLAVMAYQNFIPSTTPVQPVVPNSLESAP